MMIQAATGLKGRGTPINPHNRFEALSIEAFDDGWEREEEQAPPRTTLIRDATRSIIARNNSPDIGFDRSINAYRGCEHGCVYCFARPSHAYLGFSPGLDFETKLVFKPDAVALLEKELAKPGYKPGVIQIGANTDPYQPIERTLKLTAGILEVLDRHNHPVAIVTKSAGVLRDVERLASMAKRGLVRVHLSITTLDPALARVMEPRAASPSRRLAAIAGLRAAGIPAGVLASPMIPGLNDSELESILEAAAKAGAQTAATILLRLPHELKELFTDWLNRHVPDRAQRILSLIRQTRGGALNEARFGMRFTGAGPYADMLHRRFARAAKQYGFAAPRPPLNLADFRVPAPPSPQLSLF